MTGETQSAAHTEIAPPLSTQEPSSIRRKAINFSNAELRETHIRLFLQWLPSPLRETSGVEWERLPSKVMGYLIRTIADGPDVIPLTFAVGCAMYGMKKRSLYTICREVTVLLRQLRAQYGMQELAQLGSRSLWDAYAAGRTLSSSEVTKLTRYDTLAAIYVRTHLDKLSPKHRLFWEQYALPPLPRGFLSRDGHTRAATATTKQKRREQSDVLVPLFPLLVEIAQLRKQAAERLISVFRTYRERAKNGEIELPYAFEYTDCLLTISQDAPSLAEVRLVERKVTISFILWDRVTWVQAHPNSYGRYAQRDARLRRNAYAPERLQHFLQLTSDPGDLLWCGDLIVNQKLMFGKGCLYTTRPGLLNPGLADGRWLLFARRLGKTLLEPESFYLGALYASALATLVLTNGSRLSELLQVSAQRFETLVVDELKNQRPTGRKIGILVQNLLPKGGTQESERQFFLISDLAARHLREIGELLEATHNGTIPVVNPSTTPKEEDLYPEPYFFQWASSADGRAGVLTGADVSYLLRFLFHGLTLTTRTGTPIQVAAHLLRHVLASHARQVQNVPAEAVAYLLHHRVLLDGEGATRSLTISEATAYYSSKTMEQLLALLFEAQSMLLSSSNHSYLQVPPPRTLAEMDEALRQIFEQWGTIGPTVLGYCGAGLCIRPNNRALCLDCPHLVPHYSNLPKAKTWRKLYVLQAQLHDEHGHHVDARQARQMIQHLDDIINLMQIQMRVRQDAGLLPLAETLLPKHQDEGGTQ